MINIHYSQLRATQALESMAFQVEATGDLMAPAGFEACRKCQNRCMATADKQVPPAKQHLLAR